MKLAVATEDPEVREKLISIAGSPTEVENRSDRGLSIADALMEFGTGIGLDGIYTVVPPIKARMYSIASSYRAINGLVDLLVVQHEWDTKDGGRKAGLCSSFIRDLRPGDKVTAGIHSGTFHLPNSEDVPMVMAGLGTGLAPFRSFIQERAIALKDRNRTGDMLVFYGCRHRSKDYAFGNELEEFHRNGVITTLAPAFSRDQAEKIYIQNRIREHGASIYKALVIDKGHFYLCGQAGHMASQIEDSLIDAFCIGGGVPVEEARNLIEVLRSEKRFSTELY